MKLFDPDKKFYKGNLHVHTTVSDGRKTPEEVKSLYQQNGYDFLALTDHWKMSPADMCGDMLVLPGMEIDYTFEQQVLHVVCIMPDCSLQTKIERGSCPHQEAIDLVNRLGGAAIVAHPSWSLNTKEMLMSLDGVCAAEVYNTLSGTPWNASRADSAQILDVVSTWGRYYPMVAADDSHFYQGEACVSYTMVQADALTPEAIIAALKRGSFYASQGPEFLDVEIDEDQMIVRTTPVARVTYSSNLPWVTGRTTVKDNIVETSYRFNRERGECFVRCEVEDKQGRKAWLSPIAL